MSSFSSLILLIVLLMYSSLTAFVNRITCVSCGVSRFRARFSNNQIRKYQEAIVRQQHNGPPASLPRCSDCTTGNVVELTCQGCQVTKGVDFFSSNQRKTPDNAVSGGVMTMHACCS